MSINIGINGFGRIGRWVILFLASDALVWPTLMGLSIIIRGGCRQQCHGQSCSLIVCSCRRIYRVYELLSCISFWNCSSIAGCIVYVLSWHTYLTSYHHYSSRIRHTKHTLDYLTSISMQIHVASWCARRRKIPTSTLLLWMIHSSPSTTVSNNF